MREYELYRIQEIWTRLTALCVTILGYAWTVLMELLLHALGSPNIKNTIRGYYVIQLRTRWLELNTRI